MEALDWSTYDAEDLDAIKAALVRESAVRHTMEATGESREVVVSVVDANLSMDSEAVLDLTDGEPTTLKDALRRYADDLVAGDELSMQQEGAQGFRDSVVGDLHTLLDYHWPGER